MSDAWKGHWLEFVKPPWLREGLLQVALSAALNECEAGLADDRLADAVRVKVRGPLESEAWIPGTLPAKEKKVKSAVNELVRGRQVKPAPIEQAVLSAVTRWGEADDPAEGLVAAVQAAAKEDWKLPDESIPLPTVGPPRRDLRPAKSWLDAAQALQAWRRLVPALATDPDWRERCQKLRSRVGQRNEEGNRLFEWLAKWYSGEDHKLFADVADLIDDALGMADPKDPDAVLGVTLPVRWPPLILARELSGEVLHELQLEVQEGSILTSPDDLVKSWRALRDKALKAIEGRLREPGDAPPRKELPQLTAVRPAQPGREARRASEGGPPPAEERNPALLHVAKAKSALERSMELKARLGPLLEPIERAITEGKEVPLDGLLKELGEATQAERYRGPLGDTLMHLREALRLAPFSVELLPPDLSALGQPADASAGSKSFPVRKPGEAWGRVVGLRFEASRGGKRVSEKQSAVLVAIPLPDEVFAATFKLLDRTSKEPTVAEERQVFFGELLKSDEAFREQFRQFYRAYFRRYEAEPPPPDDPTAQAFHAVCEAMGLQRFDIPRSWDEARGEKYKRTASTAEPRTLDWQVHPGWSYKDETEALFVEAWGVYQ